MIGLDTSPKKKLGQNFLIDGNIVDKSIQLADLPESGNVVEIGPGLGTLTRKLLESGQTVHAVELDQRLADNLENTETEAISSQQLTITRGDAVKLPLGSLPESVNQYAIVANLPYAISSAWLESVLNTGRLHRMVLMMQKEKQLKEFGLIQEPKNIMHLASSYRMLTSLLKNIQFPGSVFIRLLRLIPCLSEWT